MARILLVAATCALAACAGLLGVDDVGYVQPAGGGAEDAGGADADADVDAARPVVVVAAGQLHPSALATDLENVYWTSADGIWSCPLSGGPPRRLVAAVTPGPVALGANDIYFVDGNGSLLAIPKTGSSDGGVMLGSGLNSRSPVVRAGVVLYMNRKGVIDECWLDVGPACVAHGYFASDSEGVSMATDGMSVWWTTSRGEIRAALASNFGSAGETYATGEVGARGFVLDTSEVLWVTSGPHGAIRRTTQLMLADAGPEGGSAETVAGELDQPWAIALDGQFVYVANYGAGNVSRVSTRADAGAPERLIEDLVQPEGIAIAGGSVYVTSGGDGRVLKFPKKP